VGAVGGGKFQREELLERGSGGVNWRDLTDPVDKAKEPASPASPPATDRPNSQATRQPGRPVGKPTKDPNGLNHRAT